MILPPASTGFLAYFLTRRREGASGKLCYFFCFLWTAQIHNSENHTCNSLSVVFIFMKNLCLKEFLYFVFFQNCIVGTRNPQYFEWYNHLHIRKLNVWSHVFVFFFLILKFCHHCMVWIFATIGTWTATSQLHWVLRYSYFLFVTPKGLTFSNMLGEYFLL